MWKNVQKTHITGTDLVLFQHKIFVSVSFLTEETLFSRKTDALAQYIKNDSQ